MQFDILILAVGSNPPFSLIIHIDSCTTHPLPFLNLIPTFFLTITWQDPHISALALTPVTLPECIKLKHNMSRLKRNLSTDLDSALIVISFGRERKNLSNHFCLCQPFLSQICSKLSKFLLRKEGCLNNHWISYNCMKHNTACLRVLQ